MNFAFDVKSFLIQGNSFYDQALYEEAINKYKVALESNPNSAQAYYNWGNALKKQGKFDDAMQKYKKATEINPKLAHAYNNWGLCLHELTKYDDAMTKYLKTIEVKADFSQAYNNWGLALDAKEDYTGAILKYQKAIEINPKYSDAYYNWGNSLCTCGEVNEAADKYSKAIEVNPKHSKAYHNLGVVFSATEQYDEACKMFSKAVEIDPCYVDAYNSWGYALYEQKKDEEASKIFTKGVQAMAKDPKQRGELINVLDREISQSEENLKQNPTPAQREETRNKIRNIKQIFELIMPSSEPQPVKVERKDNLSPQKSPEKSQVAAQEGPLSPDIHARKIIRQNTEEPNETAMQIPLNDTTKEIRESQVEQEGLTRKTLEKKESLNDERSSLFADPKLKEYFAFVFEELSSIFDRAFTTLNGRLIDRSDTMLSVITFCANFLPPLSNLSFDEKVFPVISKIAPDGILLEDVLVIRRVNKIYQQFVSHFSDREELKAIVENVCKGLTVLRKSSILAEYGKPVNAKSLYKIKQGKARMFVKRENLNNKAEEMAFFDLGMLVIFLFLEGVRIEEYTTSTQKIENISKGILAALSEYTEELRKDRKNPSEWCNMM